jgi:hypothetical protein
MACGFGKLGCSKKVFFSEEKKQKTFEWLSRTERATSVVVRAW